MSSRMPVASLVVFGTALLVGIGPGCSENELRVIYEQPAFFDQPSALGPTQWSDEFQQRTVDASDILFVIDDSCSMSDEQDELAANFENFIQTFVQSTIDYHVGVVRAALGGDNEQWGILEDVPGFGGKWIDQDTGATAQDKIDAFTTHDFDGDGIFEDGMAGVGTGGGACEMALQASFSALTYQTHPGYPNEGFLRDDANLAIIVLSDEMDHGQDPADLLFDCNGISPQEYIPWFLYDLKGLNSQDQLVFTGIVGDRPGGCGTEGEGAQEGRGYWDVIDGVGGSFLSICSSDWSQFLTELGYEAAGLRKSFHLRRIPREETLVVTIDDEVAVADTWSYNRETNSIDFPTEYMPAELAVIVVTYELVEDAGSSVPVDADE